MQQVEIRQNPLVSTSKTNKKHYVTTLQRRVRVAYGKLKEDYDKMTRKEYIRKNSCREVVFSFYREEQK